ncbi:MAG: HtaA domain-containing protein, partial [Acidimicrobiia bacterium]
MRTHEPTGRKRLVGLLVAVVAVTALLATPTAAQEAEPTSPVAITSGAGLDWGIRGSWRNYIGAAGTTVRAPATLNPDGTFHFPIESGTYDPATRAVEIQFAGEVHFYGHAGLLDMTVSDPRVVISSQQTSVYLDVVSRDLGTGQFGDFPDTELVTLLSEQVTPVVTGTTTTWSAIPSRLTEVGAPIFIGYYASGAAFDPVTFGYDGPGGAPDYVETWAVPGAPVYQETVRLFPSRTTAVVRIFPDPGSGVLHAYVLDPAAVGGVPGQVLALDPVTLETLGSYDLDYQPSSSDFIHFDTTTSTLHLAHSSALIRRLAWNGSDYEALANLVAPVQLTSSAVYDTAGDRYLIPTSGDDPRLDSVTFDAAGEWTRVRLTPTAFRPERVTRTFIDGRGNLFMPPTTFVDLSGPSPAVSEVPGSSGVHSFAQLDGDTLAFQAYVGEDGSVAYENRIVRWVDGAWVVAEARPSVDLASTGNRFLSLDPDRGVLAIKNNAGLFLYDPSGNKHSFAYRPGAGLAYFDGSFYDAQQHHAASNTVADLRRFTFVGYAPELPTQPVDATVALAPGQASGTATFTVVATGDPAPTVRWQSREPGALRFYDVPGADSPTLTVAATAALDGTQYRAVATNAAGSVASSPVTLAVEGATPAADEQTIVVGVPALGPGELAWSIDGTGPVEMGTPTNAGDHWAFTGNIHPVIVSDT